VAKAGLLPNRTQRAQTIVKLLHFKEVPLGNRKAKNVTGSGIGMSIGSLAGFIALPD
jgi:hypothetical protein